MTPDDAQTMWLASKTHSDQFLLFAFDAEIAGEGGVGWDGLVDGLLDRAGRIPDLNLAATETVATLDYPYWTSAPAGRRQIVTRATDEISWRECLDDVGTLVDAQVDPRTETWRVHLYRAVTAPPDGGYAVAVAVLQISHALADGRRATAIARRLLGSEPPRAAVVSPRRPNPLAAAGRGLVRIPVQLGGIVVRGRRAYRLAHADQTPVGSVGPGRFNVAPGRDRQLRCIVVDADRLRIGSHGVTVGAIIAISDALAEFQVVEEGRVVVELMMARSGDNLSRNNFHTVGIDSRSDLTELAARADAIAQCIVEARRRDDAPARVAARHASAATPAMLMRWGTAAFDSAAASSTVTGHTVVSSVNRGAGDVTLGGRRVRFTAGFPALSTMQGLTHGVHGIGSTVTISVTTSRRVTDVDRYVELLEKSLRAADS